MGLFNRPAWAKTQTADQKDTEENLFSHSSRSYQEIVAEEQRRKKDRVRAKLERKLSEAKNGVEADSVDGGRESPKRRRITLEEGADLLNQVGMGDVLQVSNDDVGEGADGDSAGRRSPRVTRTTAGNGPKPAVSSRRNNEVIELGEGSDEDDYVPRPRPRAPDPEVEEEESDEDVAELKRQARARRRKQEEQNTKHALTDPGVARASTYPTPPLCDPPIKLFISSELPNTQPLIVYRKLSQRLKEIREVWCAKQHFSDEQKEGIFLVHNMKRIYDVTTCRSLGLDVDSDGIVTMKGAEGMDDLDKVHLEAVDEKLFQQMQAKRARGERERRGLQEPEDEAGAGTRETGHAANQGAEEQLIKVFLKAKGREPFRLKVKPVCTTPALAFRYIADHFVDDVVFQDHLRVPKELWHRRGARSPARV